MVLMKKFCSGIAAVGTYCLPQRCALCRAINADGFCPDCSPLLPWMVLGCEKCAKPVLVPGPCPRCLKQNNPLDYGLAAFRYASPIANHIQKLKYGGQLHLATALGKSLAYRVLKSGLPFPDTITPVPLHRNRQRQRGFNQSYEIARSLAHALDLGLAPALLSRTVDTRSQTRLTEAQRRRNVRNCFAAAPLRARHVALIDDVITSGSTVREAARALKRAGATTVSVWAIATT